MKKYFYHKGDQALAQVAWRGCGVSILGDIWSSAGYSPLSAHPAVAGPALRRGLDQSTSKVPSSPRDSGMKVTGQLRTWQDCGCTNTIFLKNLANISYFGP